MHAVPALAVGDAVSGLVDGMWLYIPDLSLDLIQVSSFLIMWQVLFIDFAPQADGKKITDTLRAPGWRGH